MIRQPVQRGVGEDQIGRIVGGPARDVAMPPVDLDIQCPGLVQHGAAGIQPMHPGQRVPTFQQGRMLASPAPQVPDLARFQVPG